MTACEPEVVVAVVQGEGTLQAVALVAAHVKVAVWPAVMVVGAALNVRVGLVVTVTVALAETVPPGPVHVIV